MFFLVSPSQIQLGPGPMRKSMSCSSEIHLSHHMASRSPGLAHDLALEGHGARWPWFTPPVLLDGAGLGGKGGGGFSRYEPGRNIARGSTVAPPRLKSLSRLNGTAR